MKFIGLFFISFMFGCQTGVNSVSERPLPGIVKNGDKTVYGAGVSAEQRPSEIFLKKSTIRIERNNEFYPNGSLYREHFVGSDLFADPDKTQPGSYIDVQIESRIVDDLASSQNVEKPGAPEGADEITKKLLEAIPELDSGKKNPSIPKSLRMKVLRPLENGNLLMAYSRNSISEHEANHIMVTAELPRVKVQSGAAISTSDLSDVSWTESMDGDYQERKSTSWEDYYTLKVAGFSEANSRLAEQLQEQKKQLDQVRNDLRTRIETFGAERKKVAEERQASLNAQADAKTKVQELNQTIDEQKSTIKEQKAKIQELTPEENAPGEEGEDADGA